MTNDPDAIKANQEEAELNTPSSEERNEAEILKAWRLLKKNGYEVRVKPPEER